MSNEFEFSYGNETVYTGMQTPDSIPLSFQAYPEATIRSIEDIHEIIKDKDRPFARDRWGQDKLINQGRRSSCNAYMAAGMLMRQMWYDTGEWVELQPEHLYMHINGGQDNGSMLDRGMVRMCDNGIAKKGLVPYQSYRTRDVSMEELRYADQDGMNQRGMECYKMPSRAEQCWHAMLSCLVGMGTVGIAVHVGNGYMRSGAMAGFDRGPGNHAVLGDDVVALTERPRSAADFAIHSPQSWGTRFADGGFTKLTIKHIEQTCSVHALYGMRSATTDLEQESQTRIR